MRVTKEKAPCPITEIRGFDSCLACRRQAYYLIDGILIYIKSYLLCNTKFFEMGNGYYELYEVRSKEIIANHSCGFWDKKAQEAGKTAEVPLTPDVAEPHSHKAPSPSPVRLPVTR